MATQTGRKAAARPQDAEPEFDFTRSPIHLLRRAQQRALEIFNREVGASGLTPRQFIVLLAVQENEGLTQTDLVNRTGIDRSTLADMISRLTKREMLGRRRTERDQRANAVTITGAGRKALRAALARVRRAEEKLLEQVPENKRTGFLEHLGVLADTMEKEADRQPQRGQAANGGGKAPSAKSGAKAGAVKTEGTRGRRGRPAASAEASAPAQAEAAAPVEATKAEEPKGRRGAGRGRAAAQAAPAAPAQPTSAPRRGRPKAAAAAPAEGQSAQAAPAEAKPGRGATGGAPAKGRGRKAAPAGAEAGAGMAAEASPAAEPEASAKPAKGKAGKTAKAGGKAKAGVKAKTAGGRKGKK